MNAVHVSDLRKEFVRRDGPGSRLRGRRVPALRDVSFDMERGECVAILGQNGSGEVDAGAFARHPPPSRRRER